MRALAIVPAVLLGTFLFASEAAAANCVLQGYYRVEPRDTFYCDTDHIADCSGWKEVDLDDKRGANAAPLQYMRMVAKDSAGNVLAETSTGASGYYSMVLTLPGSTCTGQSVQLVNYFQRIHGDDVYVSNPRSRFAVVNGAGVTYSGLVNLTLSGPNHNQSRTYAATETATNTRVANLYYIINSMVTEVVWWSGRLNDLFTGGGGTGAAVFKVFFSTTSTEARWGWRELTVPHDNFADGPLIRHEMGHSLHKTIHDLQQPMESDTESCMSYKQGNVDGHSDLSCEYGFAATREGLASFFALRSVTSADTGAFFCSCNQDELLHVPQDVCSATAAGMLGASPDADRIRLCNDGVVAGVGDRYSDSTTTCARLNQSAGCDCASNPCEPEFRAHHGWQNENQVMRFLWDLIDSNNEGGQDDTNESIQSFVAALEGMPCDASILNVDGTCNEPNRKSGNNLACTVSDTEAPSHMGTRHSYNVWDIAELIPGDQSAERVLNCADGAHD